MRRRSVAQTQARGEERVRLNLERQGFHAGLPRDRRERRYARRRDIVKAPQFPGHVFVALHLEEGDQRPDPRRRCRARRAGASPRRR